MNQAIILPPEYTVGTTLLSPTDHRVLTSWYTGSGIILKLEDNRKSVAVPLVDDDKVQAMMKMYPRMFPWLQAVYHYEPVSDRHIATLLWYAGLGQSYPHHYLRSCHLNVDHTFTWDRTLNETVFLTLHRLYVGTPTRVLNQFLGLYRACEEEHARQFTSEFGGADNEDDDYEEEDDDD